MNRQIRPIYIPSFPAAAAALHVRSLIVVRETHSVCHLRHSSGVESGGAGGGGADGVRRLPRCPKAVNSAENVLRGPRSNNISKSDAH